jgi:hypothetical protein
MPGFVYPRLLMSTILAYLVYIDWFSVPVLIGLFETVLAKILYSNIVLGVCITMAVILAFKELPVGIFEVPEEHTHH